MERKRTELLPWLSARQDNGERRFIMIGNSLIFNKNFQSLSLGARHLYYAMAMESAGNIQFCFPLATAKKHGFSQASFRRYINELISHGFIIKVYSGKRDRKKNIYRFSFDWKKTSGGAYKDYIESDAWKAVRRKRMSIDGYQCQMCGTAKNLEVHHLTYERLGHEDMDDLITLCRKCHEKVHKNDLKKRS